MNIFVVFICVFLAGSGAVAIINALNRLANPKDISASDSALETKLFKWSAPAGLTYGIVCLLLVLGIIKFWSYPDQKSELSKLQNQLELIERDKTALLLSAKSGTATDQVPRRITLTTTKSESVLGGNVVVTYELGKASKLHFQGILGLSKNPAGPFSNFDISVARGDQFFIKLRNSTICGINVLDQQSDITIEIFHSSEPGSPNESAKSNQINSSDPKTVR